MGRPARRAEVTWRLRFCPECRRHVAAERFPAAARTRWHPAPEGDSYCGADVAGDEYENVYHDGVQISVTFSDAPAKAPEPEERTRRFLADWPATLALLDD
jgi:hypothetical protein